MKILSLAALAALLAASSSALAGGPPTIQKPQINIQIIGTKSNGSTSINSNQTGTVNFLGVSALGGKSDVNATQKGQYNAAYVGTVGKSSSVTLQQQGTSPKGLNYGQINQRSF